MLLKIGRFVYFKKSNGTVTRGEIYEINESHFKVKWKEYNDKSTVFLSKTIDLNDEYQIDSHSISRRRLMVLFKWISMFKMVFVCVSFIFCSATLYNYQQQCKQKYFTNWLLFKTQTEMANCRTLLQVIFSFLKKLYLK